METDSVWSVIIVITTPDDREAGVRFVNLFRAWFQTELDNTKSLLSISHNNYNFRKKNKQTHLFEKISQIILVNSNPPVTRTPYDLPWPIFEVIQYQLTQTSVSLGSSS